MGIISADVVHNISTPKHAAKVAPEPGKKRLSSGQTVVGLGGFLKVS